MERSNDEQLAQSKPRDVTPMLATNVAGIIKETTSREAEIREWAFSLYEQRGRREGHQLEDWLDAEAIVLNRTKQAV